MSDFDDNWQITGSSDPATPDIQPHQVEPQVQPQPAFQPAPQPVQQQMPVAPVQEHQAQTPVQQYQQPVQQPAQPFQQPVQPLQQPFAQPVPGQPSYQQPAYQQPGYQQPVYQPPVYNQPGYAQPVMQGYGVPPQQAYYQNAKIEAEREKNLNECTRMINHFSPKVDLYQNYEKCKNDIAKYSRSSVAPLVWGIIVCIMGLSLVFSAVTASYKDNIIGYSIAAGVVILIGAGLILLFVLKKRNSKKKLEEFYTKLGELSTELNLLYNGFSNCILPSEFTDPRILFKIQSLILSRRCVTINDAINAMLAFRNTYIRVNTAKEQFQKETSERFDGKPAFFNAVRYLDLR